MNFHEKAALAGQPPLFVPTSSWRPPATMPAIANRGYKTIAIDVETKDPDLQALGPGVRRGAKIVGLAVGTDRGDRWYFPVRHQGGGNLDPNLVFGWAAEELGAYTGDVVGANLSYDLDFLAEENVVFNDDVVYHDVQVAEPLIDEWRDEYNLDALARDYLGEGKEETLLREAAAAFGVSDPHKNLWRFPANLAGAYAEGDVDRPLRIWEKQRVRLEADDLMPVYDIERQLIPILVAMRRAGVRVNLKKVESLRVYFARERQKWIDEIRRIAGRPIDLMDPAGLGSALADRGIHVPVTAKKGAMSIKRPFLERHQKDDLCRAILNGRKFNTLINTFLDSQIMGHQINGRLHPTFKQGRDDDGGSLARFAGSHPNLQFIPAREAEWQEDQDIAPQVRGIFEPEDGEDWQADDGSQLEFRFLTHFAVGAGAEEAREKYRSDPATDFHKMVAVMMNVPPEDKKKRKRIKNGNFASVYGAQVPKLADTFGCTIDEAQEFFTEWKKEAPFIMETFDRAGKWAQRQGFVSTILGRKMRFPFWGPRGYRRQYPSFISRSREEAYEYWVKAGRTYGKYPCRVVERINTYMALNRKLQGSNADWMKKSMVDVWKAGVCKVIGAFKVTVHDELGSSVPRTRAGDEAGRELVRILEKATPISVPIMVNSERGPDWGNTKVYT